MLIISLGLTIIALAAVGTGCIIGYTAWRVNKKPVKILESIKV